MKLFRSLKILGNQGSPLLGFSYPTTGKPKGALVGILRLFCLLCPLVLASCSSDDDAPADNSQDVTVTFTMSIGDPEQVTRAQNIDWTDYDSIPGHGFENTVDIRRLQVVLYDNNGNFISNVENLAVNQISSDSTKYTIVGNVRVDTLNLNGNTFNGKIAVYANTDTPSLLRLAMGNDNISEISFDYSPSQPMSSIPMWGVKTVSNVSLAPGSQTNIGEIWLLRAMAKVNVDLTEDMTNRGYKLTKVTLNGFNTKGYLLPSGYASIDNTRLLTYDTGSAMSFHPYNSLSTSPDESGTVAPDTINFTGKTLYIPEYDNSTTPTTISITIQSADGSTRTATFPFARYIDGDRAGDLNIVRNHAYVFHVYGNPIKIDLKVEPWTVITHPTITM